MEIMPELAVLVTWHGTKRWWRVAERRRAVAERSGERSETPRFARWCSVPRSLEAMAVKCWAKRQEVGALDEQWTRSLWGGGRSRTTVTRPTGVGRRFLRT